MADIDGQGGRNSRVDLPVLVAAIAALLVALGPGGLLACASGRDDAEPVAPRPAADTAGGPGAAGAAGALRGAILSPATGSALPDPTFRVRLRLSGREPGRHVWLMVRLGPDRLFPQGGVRQDGDGEVTVSVARELRTFVLALVTVDDADHARIEQWVATGRATGARPPLIGLPSLRYLDEIALARSGT